MLWHIGTSGFGYPQWAGRFYPRGLPAKDRLACYGRRFNATEINQSFYSMPRPEVLRSWAARTPEDFSFSFKAHNRITHLRRLRGAAPDLERLLDALSVLDERLGVLVFQLAPNL